MTLYRVLQITLYCIAETFDRKKLDELLKLTYSSGSIMSYPVRLVARTGRARGRSRKKECGDGVARCPKRWFGQGCWVTLQPAPLKRLCNGCRLQDCFYVDYMRGGEDEPGGGGRGQGRGHTAGKEAGALGVGAG